jgi:CRISPR/Cas system-associated exonuclease Cas4 (RecB family)
MTEQTFSVTEVVTAVRCPRQLVLARQGHRVVPYGPETFGQAAHAALEAIATGAKEDVALHTLLDRPLLDRGAIEHELFRLALGQAQAHAKRVANQVEGADLARFADAVRHIARLLTPPIAKARASAANGRAAVAAVFIASEESVDLALDGVTIRGRVDLLCHDGGDTWVWDLKTYAGTDLAQLEQVRLYAMAYAEKGVHARPALVHVVNDHIEIVHADPPHEGDRDKLLTLVRHMRSWISGAPPPHAPDLGTCRKCPAQSPCWRAWGRTLPDEADDLKVRPNEKDRRTSGFVTASLDPEPIWLGTIEARENKPARLEPLELVRHVAVFGAAGSGKTYLAKAFVEEAVLAGIPVLAFDVQGDILSLAKTLDEVEPAYRARRDAYRARADVRLLTPMSNAGLRISLNPLRFPSRGMPVEESTVYSETVAENLLAHVKLPPSWRDHARAYLAERIGNAMKKAATLKIEDLIAGIAVDEGTDDELLDRTHRARLAKELRLLTIGTKSLLFKLGKPLDLDALLTPSDPSKTPVNILWLNSLGDQQNKESFIAMVLSNVYEWMLRQRDGSPRVLLYFDEIGPYMPPNGEPVSKKLLKRIFKEGRKYGVCGLFCTQNFTDVDYKVVSQASTLAIGRLNAAQEKKKAADTLGAPPNFDVSAAVDKLMGSPRGRFILKRVEGSPHWLQSRTLVTVHGGTWGEEEIRAHTTDAARAAWNERQS